MDQHSSPSVVDLITRHVKFKLLRRASLDRNRLRDAINEIDGFTRLPTHDKAAVLRRVAISLQRDDSKSDDSTNKYEMGLECEQWAMQLSPPPPTSPAGPVVKRRRHPPVASRLFMQIHKTDQFFTDDSDSSFSVNSDHTSSCGSGYATSENTCLEVAMVFALGLINECKSGDQLIETLQSSASFSNLVCTDKVAVIDAIIMEVRNQRTLVDKSRCAKIDLPCHSDLADFECELVGLKSFIDA